MSIQVAVSDDQDNYPVDTDSLSALAVRVLEDEGIVPPAELSLSFVDALEMARLNGQWRGKDGPTDVLSFSIDGRGLPQAASCSPEAAPRRLFGAAPRRLSGAAPRRLSGAAPLMVGDVVICPSVAAINAPEHGNSYDEEMSLLVVHGVLHLLGMDHEDPAEAETMEEAENRHLAGFRSSR